MGRHPFGGNKKAKPIGDFIIAVEKSQTSILPLPLPPSLKYAPNKTRNYVKWHVPKSYETILVIVGLFLRFTL